MTGPYVAMVAERPEDVMTTVTLAAGLRRLGITIWTPLSYSKPKKQLERVRALDPSYVVIVDGITATIVSSTRNRFSGTLQEMAEGIADLFGDDEPTTRIANAVIDDVWNAAFPGWDPETTSITQHFAGVAS